MYQDIWIPRTSVHMLVTTPLSRCQYKVYSDVWLAFCRFGLHAGRWALQCVFLAILAYLGWWSHPQGSSKLNTGARKMK